MSRPHDTVKRIRTAFASTTVLCIPVGLFLHPALFGLMTLTLVAWGAWELIQGSAERRMVQSSTGHLLRASHVWRGEVMADTLVSEGEGVQLSASKQATFNIPDLGLPEKYTVLGPASDGRYTLTLAKGMAGSVSRDGTTHDVAEILAREGDSAFLGKSVSPGDWGVIHLDGSGHHVLFFHFVANEAIPSAKVRDVELLSPALAFSVIVHSLFLVLAFSFFHPDNHTAVFPGSPELVASYLVQKPEPLPEEAPIPGIDDGEKDAKPTSTAGAEGKSGGEGDKERARAEDPAEGEPDEAIPKSIQKGLLTTESRKDITKVLDRGGFDKSLGNALARLRGPSNDGSTTGFGGGSGFGVGDAQDGTGTLIKGGKGGPGGGGNAVGDVVTQRAIKTGGKRPPRGIAGGTGLKEKTVTVKTGTASGSLGGLTAAQINKVVFSRKNAIKTCYQRQLQRKPTLSGKIHVRWEIASSGKVTKAKVSKTTMRDGRVEDCIVRQVLGMTFPKPKGGGKAVVNYPFVFERQ